MDFWLRCILESLTNAGTPIITHLGIVLGGGAINLFSFNTGDLVLLSDAQIKALFSVIPGEESRLAQLELQGQLSSLSQKQETRTFWVDLDPSGTAIAAGIFDLSGLSSARVNVGYGSSNHQPEFLELLAVARDEDVRVGFVQPSGIGDRLLWFVPGNLTDASPRAGVAIRALSVSFDVLAKIIDKFNPDAQLTAAELRIVVQIVAGLSVSESATSDGIQENTRRGQLKRAFAKLDVPGQNAMVRLVLSQAIQLLYFIESEMQRSNSVSELAAEHLSDEVRLELPRLSDGRSIRLLTLGNPLGQPVIIAHGLFFVPLLQSLAKSPWLDTHYFLMPVRFGYLTPLEETSQTEDEALQDFAGIEFLMEAHRSRDPLLLGHSMGCVTATRFALSKPDLVPHLRLLSPYFGRPAKKRSLYLSRIMQVLAHLGPDRFLYRLVAAQFAKIYSKPSSALSALNRVFGGSPQDIRVLSGDTGLPPFDTWFGQVFRDSIAGVASDFQSVSGFELSELSGLSLPCEILVGSDDPLVKHEELLAAMQKEGHQLTIAPTAGHFAGMTNASAFGDLIGADA